MVRFSGDVEVDLTNFEWRHHGHDENPQFNTVILHVVYQHHSNHPFTIKENGDAVEVLEVHSQLDRDISKLLKRYAELPLKKPISIVISSPASRRKLLHPDWKNWEWSGWKER